MNRRGEPENKKIIFIGMRVIKTIIAVHICFLIGMIRKSLPFYSAIAAILCMQNDQTDSLKVGGNRMKGTLIGGLYGFLAIMLIKYINIELYSYIHYLILSLFLIPIIYTNVHLQSSSSTYISCVVFLSITVSHGADVSPLLFAVNRVVETLIGIVVSIGINVIM